MSATGRPADRAHSRHALHTHGSTHPREIDKDEELGKRSDDYRPRARSAWPMPFSTTRIRKRRLLLLLVGLGLIYWLLFKWIYFYLTSQALDNYTDGVEFSDTDFMGFTPSTGHGNLPLDSPYESSANSTESLVHGMPNGNNQETFAHNYNGPVVLPKLFKSLRGLVQSIGMFPDSRNILFAASSLKSAGSLLSMACETARQKRVSVHMGLFGRDPMDIDEVLEINGISPQDCAIRFHDGRPSHSQFSTDKRAERSAARAMSYLLEYVQPQAVIIGDTSTEDDFFTDAMRERTDRYDRTLIEVPIDHFEDFLWLTRLDAESLASWSKPVIDIVVRVPEGSAGGPIRLLRSLQNARYAGLRIPKITIEVPAKIESMLKSFLRDMKWPPKKFSTGPHAGSLSVKRRFSTRHSTTQSAIKQFLELFYPANEENHHVLVLDSEAELSPMYLHYIQYAILAHRYSSESLYSVPSTTDLVGISLETANFDFNTSSPRLILEKSHHIQTSGNNHTRNAAPSLHQRPSATGLLIFGSKWASFHDFIGRRFNDSQSDHPTTLTNNIPETEPSWLEYLVELMRARGWYILYSPQPFVTRHTEFAESTSNSIKSSSSSSTPSPNHNLSPNPNIEHDISLARPLHKILSDSNFGPPPLLENLRIRRFDGAEMTPSLIVSDKAAYAESFRRRIGGCTAGVEDLVSDFMFHGSTAEDLFCV